MLAWGSYRYSSSTDKFSGQISRFIHLKFYTKTHSHNIMRPHVGIHELTAWETNK